MAVSILTMVPGRGQTPNPDGFTHTYNLGATGARGWMHSEALELAGDKAAPAVPKLTALLDHVSRITGMALNPSAPRCSGHPGLPLRNKSSGRGWLPSKQMGTGIFMIRCMSQPNASSELFFPGRNAGFRIANPRS